MAENLTVLGITRSLTPGSGLCIVWHPWVEEAAERPESRLMQPRERDWRKVKPAQAGESATSYVRPPEREEGGTDLLWIIRAVLYVLALSADGKG